MTKALQILAALKAMIRLALPAADIDVIAPDDDLPAPDRLSPGGRIIIEYGDPGEPEVEFGPVYNYDHQIPVLFAAPRSLEGESAAAVVAAMLQAFGAAIAADRQLGGLVDYLDAIAPPIDSLFVVGSTPAREAQAVVSAAYSTNNPL